MDKKRFWTINDHEIITNKEDYFKYFARDEKLLMKAFEIALETRKFEIELYWKRASYFWVFVSVIFVGWYSINCPFPIKTLLMFLGLIVSFCWFCVNRGSKFWQENWELNIKVLSKEIGIPIFSLISYDYKSPFNFTAKYPYSVSKVNQLVSLFITVFWIGIILVSFHEKFETFSTCCIILLYIGILFSIFGLLFLIHRFSRSFAAKENDKNTHKKVNKENPDETYFFYY